MTGKGADLTCWDVGGPDKIRALWRHYFQGTHTVIFVVDSNDRQRMDEAAREMRRLVNEVVQENCEENVTLVILANKQDLPNAMSPIEVCEALHIDMTPATEAAAVAAVAAAAEGGSSGSAAAKDGDGAGGSRGDSSDGALWRPDIDWFIMGTATNDRESCFNALEFIMAKSGERG